MKDATAEQLTEGMDLSGQKILITGCNSGTGLETMRVLALRGARIYGSARTIEKAEAACNIVQGDTVPIVCELSEPTSIKSAILDVAEPLDSIIANAGGMAIQEKVVKHGVEAHMLVNHVGHFLLINGLLKQLTKKSRIIVYSSAAHTLPVEIM